MLFNVIFVIINRISLYISGQSNCPPPFTSSGSGRYCWFFQPNKLSRSVAAQACKDVAEASQLDSRLAYLADVHSSTANYELGELQ